MTRKRSLTALKNMVESGWPAEEKVSSSLRVTNFLITALTLAFTLEDSKCSYQWDDAQQITSIVLYTKDKTEELFKITFNPAENKVSWEVAAA